MTTISKAWVVLTDAATDSDSVIDQALVQGLRDDLVHLREWIGADYTGGAEQNHTHNGTNSALVEWAHMQVFTASGTFTVPAGCTRVKVTVVGGGGGGAGGSTGGFGQGGSGGGAAIKVVTGLVPGGTVSVTVGSGGTQGNNGSSGGNGGTSSFGAYCSATGGLGGNNSNGGRDGGTGSGGDVNVQGGSSRYDSSNIAVRGAGGSLLGNGGRLPAIASGSAGNNGVGYGGGGSGGADGGATNGGLGSSGIVIVEY